MSATDVHARWSGFADSLTAVIIASVVLAVFIMLASLVPRAWVPDDGAGSVSGSDMRRCAAIIDSAGRLACYDEIAERPLPHPAKGANAPATAFDHRPTAR